MLRVLYRITLCVFIGTAFYCILAATFPLLGVIGMFLSFGFVANLALIPSGLLFMIVGGLYFTKTRKAIMLGSGMFLAAGSLLAYFWYQSWIEREAVKAHARQVAEWPVTRIVADRDATLVFLERSSGPVCSRMCGRGLLNGSIGAYVASYQARPVRQNRDLRTVSRYREYRLSRGQDCLDEESVVADVPEQEGLLEVHRLAGTCIIARDLEQPPDGLWVSQDHGVHDRPGFQFSGMVVEIHLRRQGAERLLIHHEAGSGHYRMFPPVLFQFYFAPGPRIVAQWGKADLAFGRRMSIERVIESTTGLNLSQKSFPEDLLPAIMRAIGEFERNYGRIGDAEKVRFMEWIRNLLWQRPALLAELEPLVLRAAADSAPVARIALRTLSSTRQPHREVYVPVILAAASRPAAHEAVVSSLLNIYAPLSADVLLDVARTAPGEGDEASYDYRRLFRLLGREGQTSEAALRILFDRTEPELNQEAAKLLVKLGRQDLVRAKADLFRERLEAYQPSPNSTSSRTWAGHDILALIGLREEAERILEAKLADPLLNSVARNQLKRMLDEL